MENYSRNNPPRPLPPPKRTTFLGYYSPVRKRRFNAMGVKFGHRATTVFYVQNELYIWQFFEAFF